MLKLFMQVALCIMLWIITLQPIEKGIELIANIAGHELSLVFVVVYIITMAWVIARILNYTTKYFKASYNARKAPCYVHKLHLAFKKNHLYLSWTPRKGKIIKYYNYTFFQMT